jgi:hypothetical protein
MSGSNKLNKPKHVKDAIWRQHLTWMDVVGKQVDENFARQVAQAKKNGEMDQ